MKNEKLNLTALEKKFDFFLKLEHDLSNFIFPSTPKAFSNIEEKTKK